MFYFYFVFVLLLFYFITFYLFSPFLLTIAGEAKDMPATPFNRRALQLLPTSTAHPCFTTIASIITILTIDLSHNPNHPCLHHNSRTQALETNKPSRLQPIQPISTQPSHSNPHRRSCSCTQPTAIHTHPSPIRQSSTDYHQAMPKPNQH